LTSATVSSCLRAAPWSEVSQCRIDGARAARRLAVQRWMSSGGLAPSWFRLPRAIFSGPWTLRASVRSPRCTRSLGDDLTGSSPTSYWGVPLQGSRMLNWRVLTTARFAWIVSR